jgi:hypothetical protein
LATHTEVTILLAPDRDLSVGEVLPRAGNGHEPAAITGGWSAIEKLASGLPVTRQQAADTPNSIQLPEVGYGPE